VAGLGETALLDAVAPQARRFVLSLRLVAAYRRVGRDPAAELAVRLGSVESATSALELAERLPRLWPEAICVGRFCCRGLSHDEVTIAAIIETCADRDRPGFDRQLAGFVRSERIEQLWQLVLALVATELAAR
jgi:hypothetical protein